MYKIFVYQELIKSVVPVAKFRTLSQAIDKKTRLVKQGHFSTIKKDKL